MIARLIIVFAFVITLGLGASSAFAAPNDLQHIINSAPSGAIIQLETRTYEGTINIAKPLTLRGTSGTVIRGNIVISNCSGPVKIEHLKIEVVQDDTTAIKLRNTSRVTIQHNRIQAVRSANAIDLFEANDIRMIGNFITRAHDAIYVERSNDVVIQSNSVNDSRYGIHTMFANRPYIAHNRGEGNVTGAMVMGVAEATVEHNQFYKQSENVNSQGILLFDVSSSLIRDNIVAGNRVGFYIEQSDDNQIERNQIKRNFVGVQFVSGNGNRLTRNDWQGNVIEVQASEHGANVLSENYYDSFSGIDVDGDGLSDLPMKVNAFYQNLVKDIPAYQLLFQSPSMRWLEWFMEPVFIGEQTVDLQPMMTPSSEQNSTVMSLQERACTVAFGLFMMLSGFFLIKKIGVVK